MFLCIFFALIAVNDWATVSAIPPSTYVIKSMSQDWGLSGLDKEQAAYSIGYHDSQNCMYRKVSLLPFG